MTKERLNEVLKEHEKWLRTRFGLNPKGSRADLSDADLRRADLRGADLCNANLRNTGLCDANLCDADLCRADLRGAEYNERTAMYALACPEKGAFIGYKKTGGLIVELQITETAKRSSATTRKCRCSEAIVMSITNLDGSESGVSLVASNHDKNFIYKVGEKVEVYDFDENRWSECSTGIHFFITRDEAVRY